jgi:HK97 family phage portal protein
MIHIPCLSFDGIAGKSIVAVARENIGLAMAAEKFGGNFYKNNAAFSGVFENPGELNDEAYHRLKESLEDKAMYGEKAKPLLLESGLSFKPQSMPLADAQFLDSRKFQIVEIARMFGLPPHLLGDLDRATNNNIEQQSLEFISYTIWSWCEKWEAEIDRKLFTEKEKQSGKLYSHFDFGGLVRGDSKQRSDYYRTMFAIGCMSQNEIRDKEEMNPIPDGDKYFVPLNMEDSAQVGKEPDPGEASPPVPDAPGMNGKQLNGLKVK